MNKPCCKNCYWYDKCNEKRDIDNYFCSDLTFIEEAGMDYIDEDLYNLRLYEKQQRIHKNYASKSYRR